MDVFAQVLFWLSGLLVAYSYVGYPKLLKWVARRRRPLPMATGVPPAVSVIFAAYNEAKVIDEKLATLVASEFPKDGLEVLVGDDSSSDRTAEIVEGYALRYPFIHLVRFVARTGKPAIMNALAARAKGPVLVMTDANIMFAPNCLSKLAGHFCDPAVGLVAANILSRRVAANGGVSVQEDAYVRREIEIKFRQSVISGVVIAPFGAGFAIRKRDFEPVPAGFAVDDFFVALHALKRGGRAVQECDAICYEEISHAAKQEFRRKTRMSRGNFQNLAEFWTTALQPWRPLGFHFLSHKVLRWLTPGFILVSFLSCAWLAWHLLFYQIAFAFMILVALTPLADRPLRKAGKQHRVIRFAAYFLEMNLALALGFAQWVVGHRGSIWQPTQRS